MGQGTESPLHATMPVINSMMSPARSRRQWWPLIEASSDPAQRYSRPPLCRPPSAVIPTPRPSATHASLHSQLDLAAAIDRLQAAFDKILHDISSAAVSGGAALAVWSSEKQLLSVHGGEASAGEPWTASTPCLIWSASKGIAAACALQALHANGISLHTPVATLWPEFAVSGKERTLFLDLLSHRAGLAAIDQTGLAITDHEAVASCLASQPPNWPADGSHGYGARTFGFLLDEIVRRAACETLADSWERIFRRPLGLDLWFGLPAALMDTAATVLPPRVPPPPSPFTKAFGDRGSLTRRALSDPGGPLPPAIMNTSVMRAASIPSLGAIATADALARFYAILACGQAPFLAGETLAALQGPSQGPDRNPNRGPAQTPPQTTTGSGPDRVLIDNTSFAAGFMTNAYGVYGPSPSAFGHPGAGGTLAFADPALGLGLDRKSVV